MHATLEDLAKAKRIRKAYVSQVLRLSLLAPEIVEAILDGRQPAELQLDGLLEGFPVAWEGQRKELTISGSRALTNDGGFGFSARRHVKLSRPCGQE